MYALDRLHLGLGEAGQKPESFLQFSQFSVGNGYANT